VNYWQQGEGKTMKKYTKLTKKELNNLKKIQLVVPKKWGYEHWVVNNEEYCGKILYLKKNNTSSWHYHKLKHETLYVQKGKLKIKFNDGNDFNSAAEIVLKAGERFVVYRGLRHMLIALETTFIIEFSTTHFDNDSIRLDV
jgi:quercetin dioxygenase-like cupin family protein